MMPKTHQLSPLFSAVLCFVFAACPIDKDDTKGTLANPKIMTLNIYLGTMTDPESGWQQLLNAIEWEGKYVALDLSACTMNGTEFDPCDKIATGKNKIVSIVLPDVVTSISGSFHGFRFTRLKSVTLPEGLISIGNSAFAYTKLTHINLPNSLISIGDSAFVCTNLTHINLPNSLISIEDGAFASTNLAQITLPEGITSIGKYVFSGCKNLKRTNLPDSLISIGDYAFAFTDISQITLPAGVSLGYGVFHSCENIVFTLIGNGSLSVIENGRALVRDNTELLAYPSARGSITLPEGITSISEAAFMYCKALTRIVLPESLNSIGKSAFVNCPLTRITLPEGITSISKDAFYCCYQLTSITLPDSLTSIGEYAFAFTNLAQVTLPESLVFIDNYAFKGCMNLVFVTSLAATPPTILDLEMFLYTHSNLQIKVPSGSVEAYKAAEGWSEYADRIGAIE